MHLRRQADAAALVALDVEQDSGGFPLHHGEELVQLHPAVALGGAQDIAREALRVDADGHVRNPRDLALDGCDHLEGHPVLQLEALEAHAAPEGVAADGDRALRACLDVREEVVLQLDSRVGAGLAPAGGEGDGTNAMLANPLSQLLHCDEGDVVRLAERKALLQAHHFAVLAHELANRRDSVLASEAAHVVGGLCVAASLEHASRPRTQREHVARL
mmetsp:Transcript_51088/g.134956  ORF Transcript_51088/g.134956 Transcript_51088/m.134956 type:complete len:217 (-) Transcript_51088:518-1168(-)